MIKTTLAIAAAASLALVGCKRTEKKEASAPKGAENTDTSQPPPAPEASRVNPHGGAAATPQNPHGGAAGMPPGAPAGGSIAVGKTADDGTKVIGPFSIKVPGKWLETPPSSGMRMAQFTVNGDAGPAELVVYYFRGGGGSVDANLERWYGQFKSAKGRVTNDNANRLDREIAGLKVTTVDVTGTYNAAMSPANPTGPKHNKPDSQMLAAIIQTDAGPFFFKMVGPAKTVGDAKGEWDAMIESIKQVK